MLDSVDISIYSNFKILPEETQTSLLLLNKKYKNTKILVNMMPELLKIFPNSHLQIVGDGEDLVNIKSAITLGNLGKSVELTGKITDEELRLRYSSCDIYVSASQFEVCPVPTLEAMACGKPLLLYSIEPHKEIVEVSGAGSTFSSFEPAEIVKKIEEVYRNKITYSKSALLFAESHSWAEICKQISNIYDEISIVK